LHPGRVARYIKADLSQHLMHCQPYYMDVEYVAAASLLVRAEVAKKAGLWRDYFIHFDDGKRVCGAIILFILMM